MKKLVLTTLLLLLTALTLPARSLEQEFKTLSLIPGGEAFNVRGFFTRMFSGNKVKSVKTLTFESASGRKKAREALKGLSQTLKVDREVSFIRSNERNETSYIYIRPVKKDIEMLIIDDESGEVSVVFVKCSKACLQEILTSKKF